MFKILITDKLSDLGMDVFKKEKDIQADEMFNKTPAELTFFVSPTTFLGPAPPRMISRGSLSSKR